jgi:indolepyruvate ferredoxin oxidoreductase
VAAGKETTLRMREGRTRVALNGHGTPTAAFVKNANWQNPSEQCAADIARSVGMAAVGVFDAEAVASRLMGDTIFVNPMVLGYAWQKGWIPLARESLMRAMELNAVAVDANKAAFEWGRQAAHDWQRVESLLTPGQVVQWRPRETVEHLVARRVEFLTGYQNAAYAQTYRAFVDRVRAAEAPLGKTALTEAVARYLFKLMAVKDEYEVARLHCDPAFLARLGEQFEGDFTLRYHLAPPLLGKKDAQGRPLKQVFGPRMGLVFRALATLKGLRGTVLDVFGRTAERREERALIGEYRAALEDLLPRLNADNHADAVEIARIPEQIRGFGHVRARHLQVARSRWAALTAAFSESTARRKAA